MSQDFNPDWTVEVFYDGDCPLCIREIRMLLRMDRRDRIRATNIAAPEFSASHHGKTQQEFMDEIQGRLRNGDWIVGVEVFRRLYEAVGFGILVWFTRLPLISHSLGFGYRVFAKHRLRLTGRCKSGKCDVSRPPTDPSRLA
ncbi:MAG: DUF393 domain-containing protein [Planctomycetota bacterium]